MIFWSREEVSMPCLLLRDRKPRDPFFCRGREACAAASGPNPSPLANRAVHGSLLSELYAL